MVGLAIIPLLGAVGAAIDYSRANATRTAFQAALDSTALMLSKNAALQTPEQLQAAAISDFNALFVRTDAKNVSVTVNYSTVSGSKLVLNGSAVIDTNFLSVLGIDTINITASATSTWGNTRLRVALVLDNTGSMASSDKMTALKTASHNLLSQLQSAAVNPEDVYVSIVPFNKDVNVDAANYANSWLRWDLWDEVNGNCSNTSYTIPKAAACRITKYGRQRRTAPGTAASPTATRISTPPTTRRRPAPICIRPSSMPRARPR